jgi:ferritin-like metal-binding protein YciE
MDITGFHDLYVYEHQEARSFEAMLVEGLAKMEDLASEPQLKTAFREHLDATREHQKKVEGLIERLKENPREHKDRSMEVLVEQAKHMAGLVEPGPLRDAALIASDQRIEHYEMAGYGTCRTYAQQMGYDKQAALLQQTLDEEGETDKLLTSLAESSINIEAEYASEAETTAKGRGFERTTRREGETARTFR